MDDKRKFGYSKIIFFATSNLHKYEEASDILSKYGIRVTRVNVKTAEIQANSVEDIAMFSVTQASKMGFLPILVEDAGLFIDALKGFPGPFSSYIYRTIGTKGVLKLLEGEKDRFSEFRSSVAFYASNGLKKCFSGAVAGRIPEWERGTCGFGFDPIFAPMNGDGRTFAEMTTKEKNNLSHRAEALKKFAKWYLKFGDKNIL